MYTHPDALYFDVNASHPILPQVWERCRMISEITGNSSALHTMGRAAAGQITMCTDMILSTLTNNNKMSPQEFSIVFTSGATESNNMVLSGFKGPILVSAIEHASVLNVCLDADHVPVNEYGLVDLHFLESWLQKQEKTTLVSIMAANNETGVIQPFEQIYELCQKYGALFHIDAVQYYGKLSIHIKQFDFLTISGHKMGAFTGVGALIYRKNQEHHLAKMIKGGSQQNGMRAGTPPIIGLVSFDVAIRCTFSHKQSGAFDALEKVRDYMEEKILEVSPKSVVFGRGVKRLSNTTMVSMPNVPTEKQIMMFDLERIYVGSGAACASGIVKSSHVLKAMGVSEEVAKTAIRISLPAVTKHEDVDRFIDVWKKVYTSTR